MKWPELFPLSRAGSTVSKLFFIFGIEITFRRCHSAGVLVRSATAATHLVIGYRGCCGACSGSGGCSSDRVESLNFERPTEQGAEEAQEALVAHRRILQHKAYSTTPFNAIINVN